MEQTLCDAVAILARHVLPHLVVGGLAVQEHGYFRVTTDCDIVVADVFDAVQLLTADLSGPFDRIVGRQDAVKDKRNGVCIGLLPAGRVLKPGCKVPFPQPQEVCDQPRFVPLEKRYGVLRTNPMSLSFKAVNLPRELALDEVVRTLYVQTWDALAVDQ
jgi:hypothetical protein